MASSSSLTPALTVETMEKKVTVDKTVSKPIDQSTNLVSELKKDEVEKDCVKVPEISVEEDVKDKDLKVFNASDSIDEARQKEIEPVNVLEDGALDQVKEMETVFADVEIESKQENLLEKAKELAPKVEENSERNEVTEVDFQEKTVETSQDLVSELKEETEESSKDEEEEIKKEKEVNVKAKNSNKIISKVKQSFVKAKKVIIGKSLISSKTISSEANEEIKV